MSVARLATALYRTRLIRPLSAAAGYTSRHAGFLILTYHRVNDELDPFFGAVPTEIFEQHMAYVARTHLVLTVEELVERMHRRRLPRNAVAITFDDGYRDTLTHAAPILARYGLPATVFLATGFTGTGEIPWFHRLGMAFKLTKAPSFRAPVGETLSLVGQAERMQAMERTLGHFKRLPEEALRRELDVLLQTFGVTDQPDVKNLMLTWDDVHALTGLGFSIGAHTVSHPILSRVSAERAREEIHGSRRMIESACGSRPRAFAYPNGGPEDYTETVTRLVREAGFTCAVTTRFGVNTRKTSPYELKRGGPWEHHLPTFALKLAWYRAAGRRWEVPDTSSESARWRGHKR
jgi:peptidoglycan/xylan/chitin deacetylase (PgdA/CDA1 family)